ncbi:MAG: hypothetical protein ACRDJM_02120 [Actinomycetota bacterium]
MRVWKTVALIVIGVAAALPSHASGMCVVVTDPVGDVDTTIVQEYDPALDIVELRMGVSPESLTVEWKVVDLSFAHPLAATTQVWQAYWDDPVTGNQAMLRPERDALTGDVWVGYYYDYKVHLEPIFDLATNTIRVEVPRWAFPASDGQSLTNVYTVSLHYPIILGGDNREPEPGMSSFTVGASC